jgi:fatty-acid desaturase
MSGLLLARGLASSLLESLLDSLLAAAAYKSCSSARACFFGGHRPNRCSLAYHLVGKLTHLWGYRNYESEENSCNNAFIGILAAGEGWHNNHHADQRSAKHGHLWWEFDGTYLTIRLLATIGLVNGIVMPNSRLAAARVRRQEIVNVASSQIRKGSLGESDRKL